MLFSLLMQGAFAASNIDASNKHAWSTSTGWANFKSTNGGVTVYDDHLEGYVWLENVGWIRLGTYTNGGTHTYANTSHTDYGVNNTAGTLSGSAWSSGVGWIKFNPTNGGVTIDTTTGDFDGYAWGENVGWIHFKRTDNPAYKVRYRVLGALPTVELSVSSNTGTEAATTAIIVTATASNAVIGNQTVDVAVTGVDSSDYNLSDTTITITDGQSSGKVTFTIKDDSDFEDIETATLTIKDPSAGIVLGTTKTQDVSITNNGSALPPIAPTDLNATAISQTQIYLSWTDKSDNETGFKVFRAGYLTTTTAANANNYSETGLSCGTVYNYEVKATNTNNGDSTGITAHTITAACSTPLSLGGTIFNNSKVGGSIQDVLLASNAFIFGGVLRETIIGNAVYPALLEYLTVKSGAVLDNVIIGRGVKLDKKVSLGDGVQFLTKGFGIDRLGEFITTQTHFLGTIRTKDKRHANGAKIMRSLASSIKIETQLFIEEKHLGQSAELLIVGYYKSFTRTTAYMRVEKDWKVWDGEVGILEAAEQYDSLPEKMEVPVFEGDLTGLPGKFIVHTGYRLETDQSIIYNGDVPITFSVETE